MISGLTSLNAIRVRPVTLTFFPEIYKNSIQELANLFNFDESTISHTIYRWQTRCKKNQRNMEIYEIIEEQLTKVSTHRPDPRQLLLMFLLII